MSVTEPKPDIKTEAKREQVKEAAKPDVDEEKYFFGTLRGIHEETSQLGELNAEEKRLTAELGEMVRKVMSFLDVSISFPPEKFWKEYPGAKEVGVNQRGHILLRYSGLSGDKLDSESLETCPRETFLQIIKLATPELAKAAGERRHKMTERVSFLEKISRELHKTEKIVESAAGETENHFEPSTQDALTKAIKQK